MIDDIPPSVLVKTTGLRNRDFTRSLQANAEIHLDRSKPAIKAKFIGSKGQILWLEAAPVFNAAHNSIMVNIVFCMKE